MSKNPPKIKSSSDYSYYLDKIDLLPDKKVLSNLVECAETYRTFPQGSPFPGKMKYSRTPYMREIAMELSPQSDTEEVVVMKCGQGAATAGATEPLILFKIMEDPGPVLAITATDELAKTWEEDRLMPMFESSGARNKFRSTVKKQSQYGGQGDSSLKKTWPGGRLDIKTYAKVNQIRQISYQIVILEEEEEAVNAVKRGVKQGRFRDVAFARTRAYRDRRKILRISTPLVTQTSVINPAFLAGDQRYYYVPCPHCGTMQRLEWKNLIYKTDEHGKVRIKSVYYECQGEIDGKKCEYRIRNEEKPEMLNRGEWRAHNPHKAKPKTKSYTFSALYVPPGMDTWGDIAQQWVDAQGDPESLQTFVNLTLGEPFDDYSEAPPAETLHLLKGIYKRGSLPKDKEAGPVFAMLGCDVQKGETRGGEYIPGKEPRIEASLVGFAPRGRTWLIEHYVIKGQTTDYRSGAFKKLKNRIIRGGFPIKPQKIFIDSGYQPDIVRKFCEGSNGIFPIMGDGRIKEKYFRKIDLPEFRTGAGGPLPFYELKGSTMKRRIYNNLLLRKDPVSGDYPDGYMMFPENIEQRYFEQLTAERPIPVIKNGKHVGYNWDAGGRANEALDCFVYAWFACEIYKHEISIAAGEEATNEGRFWQYAEKKHGKKLAA